MSGDLETGLSLSLSLSNHSEWLYLHNRLSQDFVKKMKTAQN